MIRSALLWNTARTSLSQKAVRTMCRSDWRERDLMDGRGTALPVVGSDAVESERLWHTCVGSPFAVVVSLAQVWR